MKNFDENELIDKAMAGRLNADEQRLWEALLAERPELETELQIGRALRAMPEPPAVSSNFTALVLQEITKVAPERAAASWADWFRWPLFARWAGAAVVAVGIVVAVIHHQNERREVAESVQSFAGGLNVVAARTDVQPQAVVTLLEDFDAIRHLPARSSDVDDGLLAALRSNE
jgi:hypothetical protein